MYAPGCSIQRLAELKVPGMRRRMAGDVRPKEAGRWRTVAAETITSVNNII